MSAPDSLGHVGFCLILPTGNRMCKSSFSGIKYIVFCNDLLGSMLCSGGLMILGVLFLGEWEGSWKGFDTELS